VEHFLTMSCLHYDHHNAIKNEDIVVEAVISEHLVLKIWYAGVARNT